jgi:hypothetical protein
MNIGQNSRAAEKLMAFPGMESIYSVVDKTGQNEGGTV